MTWLFIFFGFLGVCLIVLFIINIFAKKFLNGDYIKLPPEEKELVKSYKVGYDDSVEVKPPGTVSKDSSNGDYLKQKQDEVILWQEKSQEEIIKQSNNETGSKERKVNISPYERFSQQAALIRIEAEGSSNAFASRANVKLRFQYEKEKSVISGTILSLDGLSFQDIKMCPDVICFHIKMKPSQSGCKTETMWKKSSLRTLSMPFSLGPLKNNDDPTTNICFRLYGKTKAFAAKEKCYGECFVPLNYVTKSNRMLEVHRHILPKSSGKALNETPTTSLPNRELPPVVKSRVGDGLAPSTDSDCDCCHDHEKTTYYKKTFNRKSTRHKLFHE